MRQPAGVGPDVARAHRQHQVPVLENVGEYRLEVVERFDENRLHRAAGPDRAGYRTPVGTGDRRLTRGVDIEQHQHVRFGQYLREIVQEIAGARVAVRLEHEDDAALRITGFRGREGCRDLRRVVPVIVYELDWKRRSMPSKFPSALTIASSAT